MLEKNKKMSSFVRLLASLCLIGGLTAATGCVGGGGGGNNGNNGNDCASGEVFVEQLGECKTECQSGADCGSNASCTAVAAQNTSVCIETSGGDAGTDTGGDTGTDSGTDAGQCPDGELDVNGTCFATCADTSECGDREECIQATQSDSICAPVNGKLGEACESAADCNPPADNVPNGQAVCLSEDQNGNVIAPGGYCSAAPCNPQASLLESGCGVDGLCVPIGQDQAACFAFCSTNSDCPRGETDDYACNVFSRQQGQNFGFCFVACQDNTDCQDADGNPAGVCNDAGQCESFCDPADQDGQQSCESAGGTCVDDSGNPDNSLGGLCQFG